LPPSLPPTSIPLSIESILSSRPPFSPYLSRDPYEIYLSTQKLHEKLLIQWCLQRPPYEDKNWIKGNIISHFRRMYDAYFQDVKLLGPDELIDIRYTDLLANPMETLRSIYEKFHIDRFDENMRPAILAYQEAQKEFKVNQHQKLSEEERAVVADVWADYFAYYKYNP
ncbi:hypothetical protein NGA_0201500, partial [Nannochloropsis gaditana CCMP526]|uniref:uncharacterized protein n=1 Tax=Nannochloropsis gaditana (strain CCMP526) TaxID=1093141 RepID=UPI00029F7B63